MLETNESKAYANSRVPTKAKIRIAIADDHPIFRDGLCRFFLWRKISTSSLKWKTGRMCRKYCSNTIRTSFCSISTCLG